MLLWCGKEDSPQTGDRGKFAQPCSTTITRGLISWIVKLFSLGALGQCHWLPIARCWAMMTQPDQGRRRGWNRSLFGDFSSKCIKLVFSCCSIMLFVCFFVNAALRNCSCRACECQGKESNATKRFYSPIWRTWISNQRIGFWCATCSQTGTRGGFQWTVQNIDCKLHFLFFFARPLFYLRCPCQVLGIWTRCGVHSAWRAKLPLALLWFPFGSGRDSQDHVERYEESSLGCLGWIYRCATENKTCSWWRADVSPNSGDSGMGGRPPCLAFSPGHPVSGRHRRVQGDSESKEGLPWKVSGPGKIDNHIKPGSGCSPSPCGRPLWLQLGWWGRAIGHDERIGFIGSQGCGLHCEQAGVIRWKTVETRFIWRFFMRLQSVFF